MMKIIKVIVCLFGFWIAKDNACMAQTDSTKYRIVRKFYVCADHLKLRECNPIETRTTIVVTFDSFASVENIFLSDTDDCFTRNKEDFAKHLKSELNGLNLEEEGFSNGYILIVLFVTKMWETLTTNQEDSRALTTLFTNLDEAYVADKELKFWTAIAYSIYKPAQ